MSATPSFDGDSGDEYEAEIQAQRAQNQALLASLDLQNGGSSLLDPEGAQRRKVDAAAEERKKKRQAEQRAKAAVERKKRKASAMEEAAAGPTRVSARLKGKTPVGMEEEHKRAEVERQELEEKRAEARKVLFERHALVALLGGEEEAKNKVEKLTQLFADAVRSPDDAEVKEKKAILPGGRSGRGEEETSTKGKTPKELQSMVNKMELLSVRKVTPKRIYTSVFHPSATRELIFTGDKEGHVSVWDPWAAKEISNDDDEDTAAGAAPPGEITGEDGMSYHLRIPKDSSPISCIKIPNSQPNKLFSSSYNSTLRKIDLEKGISELCFSFANGQDAEDDEDGALLSIFDFQREDASGGEIAGGDVLWCGDHRGGVIRVDLREPTTGGSRTKGKARNWQRWQVAEKKIGGLSLSPTSPHLLSVATLSQSIYLFDIRSLSSFQQTSSIPLTYKHVDEDLLSQVQSTPAKGGASVGYHKSRLACTSVDFSSDGTTLAGVSYDDVVKVWDLQASASANAGSSNNNGSTSSPRRGGGQAIKKEAGETKRGLLRFFKKENDAEDLATSSSSAADYNLLAPQPTLTIPHNNNTGKWLTLFRIKFNKATTSLPSGASSLMSIGSMSRHIDLFDASTGSNLRSLYDGGEWMSAVPAVTAWGENQDQTGLRVVGGNASGRCVLWGIPE